MTSNISRPKSIDFEDFSMSLCGLITIAGVSKSGKTQLLKAIMRVLLSSEPYRTYVFSPYADLYREKDYNFTAGKYVRKINMKEISRIKARQDILKTKSLNDKRINVPWIILILDDFIGSEEGKLNTKRGEIISELATGGRHSNICTILLTQHLKCCPPKVRDNSNYLFATKVKRETILESIYSCQFAYENKNDLYRDYRNHIMGNPYSSIVYQRERAFEQDIYFLNSCRRVEFATDKNTGEIKSFFLDEKKIKEDSESVEDFVSENNNFNFDILDEDLSVFKDEESNNSETSDD